MENYFYKCDHCKYIHIIPAYWVSYSPEKEIDQPHIDPQSGECCDNTVMTLIPPQD